MAGEVDMRWLGFIGWVLLLTALQDAQAKTIGQWVFWLGLVVFWRQLAWVMIGFSALHWLLSITHKRS